MQVEKGGGEKEGRRDSVKESWFLKKYRIVWFIVERKLRRKRWPKRVADTTRILHGLVGEVYRQYLIKKISTPMTSEWQWQRNQRKMPGHTR